MTEDKDSEINHLKKENDRLKKELDKVKKDYDDTKKEFEEYKALHNHTVEELRKALKIRADSKKTAKPLGLPMGHKGYARHIPGRVDQVKELNPDKCPDCDTLLSATQEIRERYVTDIRLILKTINTKYIIHRKYCTNCKKIVEPEVPNVLPHARLGLNLMLLVMYLRLGLRLPGNKVCEYFEDLYSLHISEGEIVVILRQLVVAFGDYYSFLEKIVKLARVKNADSTSWRIDGKNYFAWVFIACGVVLYKIRKRNNHKVGLALFGNKQRDTILVVDRHSAHRTLAEKAGFKLQYCWSHIICDSKDLSKSFGAEGKFIHRKLKEIYSSAKGLNQQGSTEMVEQLKAEVYLLTVRHYQHKTIWRFVNNLFYRDVENLFRFVTDPDIDSTNNISERELRSLVIIRKISNGSRSTRGANATAMLLSIIQTLRLNKVNVLQGLQGIINNPSGY
jgi:transposase